MDSGTIVVLVIALIALAAVAGRRHFDGKDR
jgi:hypothetical protein